MNSIYSHTPIYKSKKPKKFLKVVAIILSILLITVLIGSLFSKDRARETKPFFEEIKTPTVIAHRGGSVYPENTLLAFEHSLQIGADVIEFDVHMTSDGHPVIIHDFTVDRTTNGEGAIDSFTLEEIKQLDAGYYYTASDGSHPFRNQGITIPTVKDVFEHFPKAYMNIEIKGQYPTNGPSQIEEKLWELIKAYNMEDQVLLASFDQKIIDRFNEFANGEVALSGGRNEVTKFVLLNKFLLSGLYVPKVDALQIPTKANPFNLADRRLIRSAEKLNMHVHYWTINDEESMRDLLHLGAHGIITDDPELLIEVMQELGLR